MLNKRSRKKRVKVLKTLPFQYATPEQAKEFVGRYCMRLDEGRLSDVYEIKSIDDGRATLVNGEDGRTKIVDNRFVALLSDSQVRISTIKRIELDGDTVEDFFQERIISPVAEPEELRWVSDFSDTMKRREENRKRVAEIKLAHLKQSFLKALRDADTTDFVYLRMEIFIHKKDIPAIVAKLYPKGFLNELSQHDELFTNKLFTDVMTDIDKAIYGDYEHIGGVTIKQWSLEELVKLNPDGVLTNP